MQDGVDMTLMGHDIKASDLFVAALENEGVTHIFALPGTSATSLVHSLHPTRADAPASISADMP